MANARFAWGIDIGNRALKAIKLVREGDALRVDDFEVIEHEHVLSNAGDNRESLIQSALANFVQRHPFKGGAVAVGVSGQSSFARFIKLPPVEPKKIPEIVRFEAIQQIPFPLDDVEWSYQLFQDSESPDVEVGIFAMRKELVNRHIQFFTDIDLNVQTVQMSPLAVYNAIYHDQRINGTTMIVDLGAENTDLIIAEGETIWLRSIPIGGNNFTEALVKAFKLNFQKAEELKRNAATSKYARQIFQAMRPIFADLVAEIQRSIGFYASVHRDSRIRKIIALGGTFRLPGLQKYLQQNLQLDVERLDGLAAGAPADAKLATTFSENLLSMVSAYGLAIQGMGDAKITSSLLPQAIRRAAMWKDKQKWFGSAAALFCLGTGIAVGSYFFHDFNYAQAEQQYQPGIQKIRSDAQKLDSEWAQIEQSGNGDRQRIKNIQSLTDYRDLWAYVITDLQKALPTPQPELLSGDIEKIKSIPRHERNVIFIDQLVSQYQPDLATTLTETDTQFKARAGAVGGGGSAGKGFQPPRFQPSFGGMPGEFNEFDGMMPDSELSAGGPAGAKRGFLITLKCTTPNARSYEFMEGSLLHALRAIDEPTALEMKKGYYVARATIVLANKIADNPATLQKLKTNYNAVVQTKARATAGLTPAAPGSPFGQTPFTPGRNVGGQTAVEDTKAYEDRVTGEDVRNDWEFTVLYAIVLDPQPAQPADPYAE